MLTKDLITEIATQTGLTKKRTEELLNTSIVVENLLKGNSVQLQNLGTLEVKEKNARVMVHPKTGERKIVPARKQLVLKPTTSAKGLLNKSEN